MDGSKDPRNKIAGISLVDLIPTFFEFINSIFVPKRMLIKVSSYICMAFVAYWNCIVLNTFSFVIYVRYLDVKTTGFTAYTTMPIAPK